MAFGKQYAFKTHIKGTLEVLKVLNNLRIEYKYGNSISSNDNIKALIKEEVVRCGSNQEFKNLTFATF